MKPFPDKKYQIIYADPPWKYKDKAEYKKFRPHGFGAEFHYQTISTDEICKLNVPADKDCILFLWVTTPFLPDGLMVMNAWKFKYKTALYWDKINMGTGHYFRGQVEVLLVGIKGKIKAFHTQIRNLISIKNSKHSKKPDIFYQIIESLGYEHKIELFARPLKNLLFEDESYKGWDLWGDEV